MANFQKIHSTDPSSQIVSQSQREEESISQNSGGGRGKGVTVLLPSDVTVGDTPDSEVFIPNAKEMAQIKRPENERFKNAVHFSSDMSVEDVRKTLQNEFAILKNHRFCCASADGQRKLNFHGKQRVWDGHFLRRKIKGNSALYILIEHEGIPRESQPSTSGLTYQQMITPSGASSEACIVSNSPVMFASNPASQQKKAAGKRKIETTAKGEKSCPSSVKQQKVNLVHEQQMHPQQGHLAASDIQKHGAQVFQQPSSKRIVVIAAPGSSQQHYLPALVAEQKENFKPPVQRRQLEKQSHPSMSVPVVSLQGSSQTCLPLQPCAVPGKQGMVTAPQGRPLQTAGSQNVWKGTLETNSCQPKSVLQVLQTGQASPSLQTTNISSQTAAVHLSQQPAVDLPTGGSRESDESQVPPSGTVSEAATAPQNVLSQQTQPLLVKTRQGDFSAPPTYNTCVNRGTEVLRRGSQQSLEQDRFAEKLTGWESLLQHSTFMSPSRKQENGTSSVALRGIQGCGQSATENLTFQRMQHGFSSLATSTQKSSLQLEGLPSQQSVNEDSMANPVQHHYQADLGDKATLWGSSSKQSMQSSVAQGSALVATQKLKSSNTVTTGGFNNRGS